MSTDRRRRSRRIRVGTVEIGGGAPVSVQSMTSTDTRDAHATLAQIARLREAGCDIVRVAVPDRAAADALPDIVRGAGLPVVADIHFDYRLALAALEAGVHKIRINPGNIGDESRVRAVVEGCRERGVPIRIGVNNGSIERDKLEKWGHTPRAMVESALGHVAILEKLAFYDICISMKAPDVAFTMEAYQMLAGRCDYPLHLGITHAGTLHMGSVKAAAGVGGLLALGIGDTLRVSLAADPVHEVSVGYDILRAVGLSRGGVELIACPTCGRCGVDLVPIAEEVERALADIRVPLRVAVMGCEVNGPGEARDADLGVACGRGTAILFAEGKILKKISPEDIVQELTALVRAAAQAKDKLRFETP